MIAGTPWLFLDSRVSWKAWKSLEKSKENFHAFRAFAYVQKSPELLTGMISGTSWLFLDSEKPRGDEPIKYVCILGFPGKDKIKFTTWHSWLLLDCGVT